MSVALSISTKFKAIDSMSSVMTKMSKTTSMFGQRATATFDRVSRAGRKLNKTFSGLGGQVAGLAGGFAVASAVQAGATAFVSFDKSITAASAKFGIFDKESDSFKAISEKAKEIGATTQFSAGEAAEGLNFLAMAGFNAEQSVAAIGGVAQLAIASQTDLATATDIASDSLGAFGLMTKDNAKLTANLSRVNDVLAKTTTTSNTNMELMFETIKEAAPVVTAAGGSIEEFAALTGILANSGIKGSKAGTTIKNAFLRLQAPVPKAQEEISKLGLTLKNAQGDLLPMSDILGQISEKTAGMGKAQKAAALKTIFGMEAIAGINVLLKEGQPAIEAYQSKIKGAGGTSKKMADFMSKGLGGVIASLSSAFESIAIAIGETFKGEIDATIKSLTEIARTSKAWIVENKDLIKTVFNAAVVIVKFMIAIKLITVAFGAYQTITKAAGIAQAAFNVIAAMNPIGLIVIAIVAAIAVIAIIIAKWDEWGAAMTLFLGPLGMVIAMIQSFRANWEMISDSFSNGGIIEGLKSIGKVLFDSLLYPVQQLFELMSNLPMVGDKFKGYSESLKGFRADMGVHIADKSEAPANPEAATNKATVLRKESTKNQKIAIDINDKSGMASIAENTGVPIQLSQTLGF